MRLRREDNNGLRVRVKSEKSLLPPCISLFPLFYSLYSSSSHSLFPYSHIKSLNTYSLTLAAVPVLDGKSRGWYPSTPPPPLLKLPAHFSLTVIVQEGSTNTFMGGTSLTVWAFNLLDLPLRLPLPFPFPFSFPLPVAVLLPLPESSSPPKRFCSTSVAAFSLHVKYVYLFKRV